MATIVSYGDSVLYASDLKTLSNPEYITDNVISVFMELINKKSNDVYCLSPSVVQLMKMTPETHITEIFEGLELSQYQIILCPVNDSNSSTSSVSGQHWSLLCYICNQSIIYHLDSSTPFNETDAQEIASKLSVVLAKPKLQCKSLCCSQQNNGFDCGVYVIYFAKQIIDSYIEFHKFDDKCIKNPLPKLYRSRLLSEIEEIKQNLF